MKFQSDEIIRLLTDERNFRNTGYYPMASASISIEDMSPDIKESGILLLDWNDLHKKENYITGLYINSLFKSGEGLSKPSILCHGEIVLPSPIRRRLINLD